jgi:hypothetical protein
MKSIKITISEEQYKRCLAFAEERCGDSDLYEKRGAFKKEDIIAGAMGEIGVWKYLRRRGFQDLSKPDFTIHDKGSKSYDADLMSGPRHFHVKSQTKASQSKYGSSWIMQRHDPCLQEIRYNHFLIPTVVDQGSRVVEIFGCISLKAIIEGGHIGELKVPWMRRTKVAIYLDSLMELNHNQRWRAFRDYGTSDKRIGHELKRKKA